MGPNG
jgi:hypothetical protein